MRGKIPKTPFDRIALCASGGGYRAASFHLGAMSYLNRVSYKDKKLLERVKSISTVSGGTITGVVYSQQKQQGKSFEEIYHFLLAKLQSLDLINMGLEKLNPGGKWDNPNKRKNLINAFAELYDANFTMGDTFEVFSEMSSHLENVVFNATEFKHALVFRMQNTGLFGNRNLNVERVVANEVKLSDAIAASSCFPVGFEPIGWPDDFVHERSELLRASAAQGETVGLMDGGIYDNQGIDAIITIERRDKEFKHDLIIITDVTSPYLKPFKYYGEKESAGWRALSFNTLREKAKRSIRIIRWVIALLIVGFSLLPLLVNYSNHILTGAGVSLGIVFIILFILTFTMQKKVETLYSKGINHFLNKLPEFYAQRVQTLDLANMNFGRIEPLFADRLSSAFSMINDIFLKVVRRLVYGRLYVDTNFDYRRMSNLIQELTERDFTEKCKRNENNPNFFQNLPGCNPLLKGDFHQVLGKRLVQVSDQAVEFGTTLWFTEDNMQKNVLDSLVACGQFSMCYNLLVYLTEFIHTPDNGYAEFEDKAAIEELFETCLADWKKFKDDPMFLVNEMSP